MRLWRRRRVYVDDLPQTHDVRFLVVFLLMLVAALGAVYAVGFVVAGDKVPAGTTVAGVEIGGLSRDAARAPLERRLALQLRRPLTVRAGTFDRDIVPASAGVSFDVEATLDEAMGGPNWDPQHMLKVLEGGSAVEPVLRVDTAALRSALTPLAAKVAVAPVDATVGVESTRAVVHAGRPGQQLGLSEAAQPIVTALQRERASAAIALTSVQPAVDKTTARAFVDDTLRPALRSVVVIIVAGKPVTIPPARFGPALRAGRASTGLRLEIGPDDLYARTVGLLRAAPGRPADARITFPRGTPVIVPSRAGTVVDRQDWASAVLAAATSPGRRAVAHAHRVVPAFTTSDAQAMHIEVPVGAGTAAARVGTGGAAPLKRAAIRLTGTVVLPGADFSLVRSAGLPGLGPLTMPLTTAVQAAAERGGMTVTSRPSRPFNAHDLGFRNTSDFPVCLRSWLLVSGVGGSPTVHAELWSSRDAG